MVTLGKMIGSVDLCLNERHFSGLTVNDVLRVRSLLSTLTCLILTLNIRVTLLIQGLNSSM